MSEKTAVNPQAQTISLDVLQEKYLKQGETSETDIFRRVARALAGMELPSLQKKYELIFYNNMLSGAIGAGRIMSSAGTDLQATLINCFVQPVGDCIQGFDPQGLPGIYEALREAAETMRRGGGVGYDFSPIRPRWPGQSATRSLLLFQTGRVIGYAGLGALASFSMLTLGWLAKETPVFHPLWSMLHITALLWGLWLMWRAEQPLWVNRTAQRVWQAMSGKTRAVSKQVLAPLWLGMAWALLPCGLLYSALLVAMFTAGALQGAMVMAAFAFGGGLMLTVFPWLWSHISNWGQVPINSMTSIGTRISGLMLAVTAAWGLYSGLTHSVSPWCLPGLNA